MKIRGMKKPHEHPKMEWERVGYIPLGPKEFETVERLELEDMRGYIYRTSGGVCFVPYNEPTLGDDVWRDEK